MGSHLFEDSRKRIKRAKTHAEAFWNEVLRLFPQDGYSIDLDKENERTWIATAVFKVTPDDELLSLELGEFFYQLRGALDAAIWQAVTIFEGSEPSDAAPGVNRLEFPITSEAKFKESSIHKFKFPDELKNWIGGIQTDSAEKPVNHPDGGLNHTLQTLHDCARKDRHRRLHVAAAVASVVHYDFLDGFPEGVTVRSAEILPANFLKGKNAFLRLELASKTGTLPSFKRHLATALKVDISVDEITNWTAEGFPEEMIRLGGATEHVINCFDSVFERLGTDTSAFPLAV